MKHDMSEPLNPLTLFISVFSFSKPLPPHISLFLTDINPSLSSEISDET